MEDHLCCVASVCGRVLNGLEPDSGTGEGVRKTGAIADSEDSRVRGSKRLVYQDSVVSLQTGLGSDFVIRYDAHAYNNKISGISGASHGMGGAYMTVVVAFKMAEALIKT